LDQLGLQAGRRVRKTSFFLLAKFGVVLAMLLLEVGPAPLFSSLLLSTISRLIARPLSSSLG
jgi:hypothetical protein